MTKIIILVITVVLIGYYFIRGSGGANPAEIVANTKAGTEFMEANKTVAGVQTTSSGLQYLMLQRGTGTKHPSATNKVQVHYEGKLLNGTVY